jgi:tRNA uridine 5-carbamoylmethylation protein Kti12
MDRLVIILQGIPGSGKSTHGRSLLGAACEAGFTAEMFSADDYFVRADGSYKYDPAKIGDAHHACFRQFMSAILAETNLVIVDNTNTNEAQITPYLFAAESYGYEVALHWIVCDPIVAARRCTHGVPEETILRMAARLQAMKPPPWWKNVVTIEAGV